MFNVNSTEGGNDGVESTPPLTQTDNSEVNHDISSNPDAQHDRATETARRETEGTQINTILEQLGVSIKLEQAQEILGEDKVFGAEKVEKAFGIKLEEIPVIPYSREQLDEAKRSGDMLVLRVGKNSDGGVLNLKNLIQLRRNQGKNVFAEQSEIEDDLDWASELPFATNEALEFEWKLVNSNKVSNTKYLSCNAQSAFMENNEGALREGVSDIKTYWQEIWGENFERGPGEGDIVKMAEKNLPESDALLEQRNQLPDRATLPTVTEAIYDHLLIHENTGHSLISGRAIATRSQIPEMSDEPVRPWDIAFSDDGKVLMHSRRSMRMGRPNQLGDNGAGVSIGYIQH